MSFSFKTLLPVEQPESEDALPLKRTGVAGDAIFLWLEELASAGSRLNCLPAKRYTFSEIVFRLFWKKAAHVSATLIRFPSRATATF